MLVMALGVFRAEARRKTFVYNYDFDNKGVMYYLGTNLNTTAWSNPAPLGYVNVNRSSDARGTLRNDSICVLDLEPDECSTSSEINAWWLIDMTPAYQIQLTGYTLRDGSNTSDTMIRWFQLLGSNNGVNWTVLDQHGNDRSVSDRWGSNTWFIDRTDSYRFFKVLQTDRNAGGTFYLSLSGIEFYGTLYGACSSPVCLCLCQHALYSLAVPMLPCAQTQTMSARL